MLHSSPHPIETTILKNNQKKKWVIILTAVMNKFWILNPLQIVSVAYLYCPTSKDVFFCIMLINELIFNISNINFWKAVEMFCKEASPRVFVCSCMNYVIDGFNLNCQMGEICNRLHDISVLFGGKVDRFQARFKLISCLLLHNRPEDSIYKKKYNLA